MQEAGSFVKASFVGNPPKIHKLYEVTHVEILTPCGLWEFQLLALDDSEVCLAESRSATILEVNQVVIAKQVEAPHSVLAVL